LFVKTRWIGAELSTIATQELAPYSEKNQRHVPQQGIVGIPYLDAYVERAALDYLDRNTRLTQPFFMSINFMKVHQPNIPHPDFIDKSLVKSKFGDSIVENDTRIDRVMDKVRALGLDKNTLCLLDHRQRCLAGCIPRCWLHTVSWDQRHGA
jgi:arylsulfatase A-like enzyme